MSKIIPFHTRSMVRSFVDQFPFDTVQPMSPAELLCAAERLRDLLVLATDWLEAVRQRLREQ